MTNGPKAVHPASIIPQEWGVSTNEIESSSLRANYIEAQVKLFVPPLTHHLILVYLEGNSTRQVIRVGNLEYDGPSQKGTFSMSTANNQASSWSWNGTEKAMMFSVDPAALEAVAKHCGCNVSGTISLKNIVFEHDSRLEWLAHQFKEELASQGGDSKLYQDSLATLFELHLLRNYCCQPLKSQQSEAELGNKRLSQVLSYIEANLSKDIKLAALAEVAGLSKCHFSEMFKRSLGVPPYRYVLLQRIERAKIALKSNDLSINEIALRCGFANQSHLTKHFRKAVGVTPRKFREQ